ncbi:MAG: UvrD-helicase domain-containing protein [bacterium]|nr:UvrD-helicase domain-containing protein [bacterium]
MSENLQKPLQILNASAGSGKTYRLVQEYIQLLIGENASPTEFKHLIAMTFTNKAALEMKERIIQALDGIGNEDLSKEPLKLALAQALKISPDEVLKRCQRVLEMILHQYEDFHVMTIDKFNLRLIKSFSRDLDLPGEFEVVLDETELIEKVVDDLLNQLGNTENSALNSLMIQYAKSNIDEEKAWNFRRNLIEFGSILKNERHQEGVKQLLDLELTTERYRELQARQKKIDHQFVQLVQPLREEVELLDSKSIHGGGHTINDIRSIIQHDQFPVQPELIKKRLAGNLEKQDGKKDIPNAIRSQLLEVNQFWENELQQYAATHLFLKNFFNMALLQHMARALNASRNDAQLIRISEFNSLISDLIQNENAPFIYERLGTRYHHFLLDEFQDTSHLQWLNLVPLIHESIGQNHPNLIVGDPKQSIYRFKNGVAEQFVELPAIYNPNSDPKIAATSSYFQNMGGVEQLENNWRSSPRIVHFNNAFFEEFRSHLPEETATFYNAVKQEPKSSKNGLIYIESREEKDSHGAIVAQLIEWIEQCLSDGYEASELCILGRRNRECNAWAVALDQAGYKVVSSDSLLIDSSAEVRLTIAFLKWRLKPSGENEKKQFSEMFLRLKHESYEVYRQYLKEGTSQSGRRYRYFDDTQFLRDHFGSKERFFFKFEHLYDLIQGFYRIANLHELENPYLHHLADWAHEYGLSRGPNLALFIEEYERKKGNIAVQVPAAKDAINIMTIHKSKGLEFPVVILPSFNINLDLKSSFLVDWNDFLLYKQPSQSDVLNPLVTLYEQEKNQILTDIVNLCYVAMTRPVERLYVRNVFEKRTFGALFHEILDGTNLAETEDDSLILSISDGERTPPKSEGYAKNFFPEDISDRLWFPHIAFQDTEELQQEDYLSDEIQFGIAFHLMASRIFASSEINTALDKALSEGVIESKQREGLEEMLAQLWSNSDYIIIHERSSKRLSEQAILLENGISIRVDAIFLSEDKTVVLDYKTGVPSEKDVKQIRQYQQALAAMGYPDVRAYLYYTALDEMRLIG